MRLKNVICAALAACLIFGFAFPGISMFVGNTSGKSFDEPGDGTGESMKGTEAESLVTVEYLVIKSATNFLKGKAHADWLAASLEAAEQDGINYCELQATVNDALYYMRRARYYYKALNDRAEKTSYNQTVIYQLRIFDYKSFSREHGLNGDIFNRLKDYLGEGDVRGAYARLLTYTENIIDELENIRGDLYRRNFPKEERIWRLNQECAQMLLFGQYMAQVFYKIH